MSQLETETGAGAGKASGPDEMVPDQAQDTLEEMGDAAAHGAWRCGECHDVMQEQWSTSGHADAAKSPLYRIMKKQSQEDSCEKCHAPLRGLPGADDHIVEEGVTCEVCHRIDAVTVSKKLEPLKLRDAHDIKYGPFCDANQRYFHRSECRPYFEQPELCGSCHLWYRTSASGASIPVYTEFEDWKAAGVEETCQDCHMPGVKGSAAVSERIRESIANHSFLGRDGSLRGSGLDVSLTVTTQDESVRASGSIRNAHAGHHLPAGMSGRQLVVRLCANDAAGKEECAESVYERSLRDDSGRPVAFYQATRVGKDTRLAPKKARPVDLSLTQQSVREVRVEIVDRRLAPEIAQALDTTSEETILLSERFTQTKSSRSSWTVRMGKQK